MVDVIALERASGVKHSPLIIALASAAIAKLG
jgi:hypothetical protein